MYCAVPARPALERLRPRTRGTSGQQDRRQAGLNRNHVLYPGGKVVVGWRFVPDAAVASARLLAREVLLDVTLARVVVERRSTELIEVEKAAFPGGGP